MGDRAGGEPGRTHRRCHPSIVPARQPELRSRYQTYRRAPNDTGYRCNSSSTRPEVLARLGHPWGTILACYGGGAILGGLLALGRRPRRPLVVANLATLGYPLPPLALALHLPVAAVAAGALLAGLGSALGGAISTTVTQARVPAQALSRVGSFEL